MKKILLNSVQNNIVYKYLKPISPNRAVRNPGIPYSLVRGSPRDGNSKICYAVGVPHGKRLGVIVISYSV